MKDCFFRAIIDIWRPKSLQQAGETVATLEKREIGRPPGRPKDDSKRDAILEAARRIFVREGLSGTTIDAIADAAGVSRVTIYSHFENKQCLMAAVMEEETQEIGSLSLANDGGDLSREEVRDALVAFGRSLLDFIEQPHVIRSGRMMIGQSHKMSAATKFFFENGPLRMHRRLGRLIASAKAAGALTTEDPDEDADLLIGMWRGLHHIELQLNAAPPRSRERRHARVRRAVDLYLAARSKT